MLYFLLQDNHRVILLVILCMKVIVLKVYNHDYTCSFTATNRGHNLEPGNRMFDPLKLPAKSNNTSFELYYGNYKIKFRICSGLFLIETLSKMLWVNFAVT